MREVQASCSSDLDLGQAGRAREGGGGSLCFLFPLPVVRGKLLKQEKLFILRVEMRLMQLLQQHLHCLLWNQV